MAPNIKLKYSKKAQLQISFGWLFAIIVGIFILGLAIYASVKFIGLGQEISGAETTAEFEALLSPLETSFEAGKTTSIEMPVETIIESSCSEAGNFGSQTISLSQKTFNEFRETSTRARFQNKYLFFPENVQGKSFLVFSKPLEMPFKAADLVYITSAGTEYCFTGDVPLDILSELNNLNQPNLKAENCSPEDVTVCFNPEGSEANNCDIEVDTFLKSVKASGTEISYADDEANALIYAAIFSSQGSQEEYECQVQRLAKRVEALALVYDEKASLLVGKGCTPDINMISLASSASNLESSGSLSLLANDADQVKRENDRARCPLW